MNLKNFTQAVAIILCIAVPVTGYGQSETLRDVERGVNILDGLNRIFGGGQDQNEQPARQQPLNQPQVQTGPSQQQIDRQRRREEWRQVQARLNELGYNAGPVDGQPGGKTKAAIELFQSTNGLSADGKMGRQTRAMLFSNQARSAQFAGTVSPTLSSSGGAVQSGQGATTLPSWAQATPTESQTTDGATPAAVSSINCGSAVNPVEAAICGAPNLVEMQAQIDQRYQSALRTADAEAVRTSQDQWVAMRAGCGGNVACLEGAMTMRLAVLPEATVSTVSPVVASVNCGSPASSTEALICETPKLMELQTQIDQRYQSALRTADAEAVRTAQDQWEAMRAGCGENAACVEGAMTMRLAVLPQAVSGEIAQTPTQQVAQTNAPTAILGKILSHPSERGTIIGNWEGVAKCAEGRTFFMTLAVQSAGGARYTAETAYVWESYLSGKAHKEKYIGEDIGSRRFDFIFQDDFESEYNIRQHIPRNFSISFDLQNDVLRGVYNNEGCRSFELTRTSQQSKSRVYLVDTDISQPTYWRAATLGEKCGFFRDYFEQPFTEYRDQERSDVERNGSGFILLADRHFAPRFGNVVDALSPVQKKQVLSDYSQCQNDPIWKSRLAPYARSTGGTALFWGFQNGLKSYHKPNPPLAADLNFWKMRKGRNEVYLAVRAAEAETVAEAIKRQMAVASDRLQHFERLFFPSEITELKVRLEAVDAKSFGLKADEAFVEVDAIADNGARIAALFTLHENRFQTMRGATDEVKAEYEAAIAQRQLSAAQEALQPALDVSVAGYSKPSEAITAFESAAATYASSSDKMLPSVKADASAMLAEKRSALLDEAVAIEQSTLSSFDASAKGVVASLAWAKAFQDTYGRYDDHPSIVALSSQFGVQRAQLLQAALPAFQTDIASALEAGGLAQARRVAESYLGWEGDAKLDISREYMRVLASAELDGLQAISSDMNKIVQSKAAYDERNGYQAALPADEYAAFEAGILDVHEGAARSLLSRAVKADQIETIDDVAKTNERLAKAETLFARMITPVAAKLKNEVTSKSSAVLEGLIAAEYDRLAGFTPDQAGVSGSAQWIVRFYQTFEPFASAFDFSGARQRYVEHRERLLGDALGSFELELAVVSESGGAEGVDQLLAQYLSWEGDRELPVALEYEFLAEAFK